MAITKIHVGEGYKKARNKEKYYEEHESQLMILDAAERAIRSIGLDPNKVSYEQVINGIEKLKEQKKEIQGETR